MGALHYLSTGLQALSQEMDINFASNEIIDEYLNVFKDYKLLPF